ncbi:MAG: protein kinase [Symploca sp. SIO3C6]|uniref:Protein kinase n=1 Tax=Symploca sp. SIO1C4 TaxID=2607765 RepID=A0A6B3N7M6_9CYAN|nr:protein kinase [Symploca sp. SIO3C6]NER29119.1 protein kinase [Symploca sp. SIO1C4]NET03447.1 protein kinase [Symploca sp. SIO2B6]
MSNYQDFYRHNYQVQRDLGENCAGGCLTYVATPLTQEEKEKKLVLIKEFQFGHSGASWADYEAHQREMQWLQQFEHPGIPSYLDSFETLNGFCLVLEYKQAPSLTEQSYWKPEEVKEIAIAVLEILVYLQQQKPPLIHRALKPENILVEQCWHHPEQSLQDGDLNNNYQLKAYLVDFGQACRANGEADADNAVKATLGFTPPEQLLNQPLTAAYDLYGLGATLICLLTGMKSTEIGKLVNQTYHLQFQHLLPHLSQQFVEWLEKMVAPDLKHRYANAAVAMAALKPISTVKDVTSTEIFSRPLKAKAPLTLVALSALSLVAGIGMNAVTSNSPPLIVHQLKTTRSCPNCYLPDSQLEHAELEGANLKGINLENADLEGANLGDAYMKGANLNGAYLYDADLDGTYLYGANLVGADLTISNLGGAYLKRSDLENAKLYGSYLGGADLGMANLEGADFEGAYLGKANLGGAYLGGANFRDVNLKGANLANANLEGANLEGANLDGANLNGANLNGARLHGTIMPDGTIDFGNSLD